MDHIDDHDLERYHLGMVPEGPELEQLEEHFLGCPECATRAEEVADYVDLMRATIVEGNWDDGPFVGVKSKAVTRLRRRNAPWLGATMASAGRRRIQ